MVLPSVNTLLFSSFVKVYSVTKSPANPFFIVRITLGGTAKEYLIAVMSNLDLPPDLTNLGDCPVSSVICSNFAFCISPSS